jgi:hypothetical protein
MASFNDNVNRTYIASVDLDSSQHYFVDIAGANPRKITVSAANAGTGVLLNKPQAGEHATVAIRGQVKVHAGAAVTAGDLVISAASGFAASYTAGVQVGSGSTLTELTILGRAVTTAASGSVFTMELDPRFTQVVSA